MRRCLLPLIAALVLAGCGSDDEAGGEGSGPLVVSAAASLKGAFGQYGPAFGEVRTSFAGSDELAAQIRQGVKPDVFASANTKLPDALFAEGLVEEPRVFAGNRLVLAVPAGSPITSVDDAAQDGVVVATGSPSVPIGAYTETVLAELGATGKAIAANVRTREPDVKGVVGKLTQGAVDAGFVYRSDVEGAGGRLEAIELPDALKPTVAYGVALVKGARNPAGGRAFVEGLLDGAGATALQENGFGAP